MPNQGAKDTPKNPLQEAIEEAIPKFEGHPAGEEEDNKGPEGTGEEAGSKGSDDQGDEKGQSDDGDKQSDDWKPKYKSHREAEKAYKEAERAMHEAKTEVKEAREELKTLKDELKEIKAQRAEGKATKKEVDEAEKKVEEAETRKSVAQKVAKALAKMNELDTSAPDYFEKVGELWVEAGFGSGAPTTDIDSLVDKKVQEVMDRKTAADKAARDEEANVKVAEKKAAAAGLVMDDPDHPDYELFWMAAKKAPRDKPFDEQVQWTIDEVKRIKTGIVGERKKLDKKADSHRDAYEPLDRGGSPPPAKKGQELPISMAEAINLSQRRI